MLRRVNDIGAASSMRVLVRADLNAPVAGNTVADSYRLDAVLPTVKLLLAKGARVILASHMSDSSGSLAPIFEYLKTKIPLSFVDDIVGPAARAAVESLKGGNALLLQNIRHDAGEEKNDEAFAQALASLADIYVNEAFPVSHRTHASIVGVPKLIPSYAGLQFLAEVEGLTPALSPESPSLAIVGGAKFATKEKLIHTLLKKYDKLFIGGAVVNDFFKAKGFEVGRSLVSDAMHVAGLLDEPKIIMPVDVTVSSPSGRMDKDLGSVGKDDAIDDIGPKSMENLWPIIEKAKTILWNGPMGRFEDGFTRGTDDLAKMVAKSNALSIVGGGDTLSSIQNLKLMDKFTFVSTAGGAMLDFLANGTLPGIEALTKSK